jgi:nitrite reductase (NADH) small subunit/3-phenylpropionate/trans-cinnamate dioxygenase ferredoxin subunit
MSEFVTVARVGEISEGKGRTVVARGREIALFLLQGQYYALDDYCPHMGASLGDSDLWQDTVVCSRHMWAFRLADGVCVDVPSLKAETFEVRVVGEEIQVKLEM